MHEFAFGVLGISPHSYYCMTERDYVAMCEGFKLKRAMDLDNIRWQMWASYNSMRDKNNFIKSPKDILKIPLVDGTEVLPTKEEIKAMFDRLTPK